MPVWVSMSPCTNTSHRRSAMRLGLPIQNGSTNQVGVASQAAIIAIPRTTCTVTSARKGSAVEDAEEVNDIVRVLIEPREPQAAGNGAPRLIQVGHCKPYATCSGSSLHIALQHHIDRGDPVAAPVTTTCRREENHCLARPARAMGNLRAIASMK